MTLLSSWVFVAHPLLTIVPIVIFVALGVASRRVLPWIAAATWLSYGIWEFLASRRVTCSGECNIRADLLLIVPILAVVSIACLIAAPRSSWGSARRSRR